MPVSYNFTLYFGGDTSWGQHFKQIGQVFDHIDVALLPIAPGEPRSWMKETHINAQEAVQAFCDLNAYTLIPMHWGTFHLGFDEFYQPIELLKKSWLQLEQRLQHQTLRILKCGELATDLSVGMVTSMVRKFSNRCNRSYYSLLDCSWIFGIVMTMIFDPSVLVILACLQLSLYLDLL